jgi:hypothetical protein
MDMDRALASQPDSQLVGPEGNLRGKLPSHLRTPREPMGSQELPVEAGGNLKN